MKEQVMAEMYFDHERLDVYRKAIEFVGWADDLLETLAPKPAAAKHLDEASTSVPLNIAEGNGKYTNKDKCKFFDIAKASALESAACLDVLIAKKRVQPETIAPGKKLLKDIVSMLIRLIQSKTDRDWGD
jgi:four helix bundle protein